jgi:tetratricopeptide (TPR) repeat protein
LPTRKEAEEYLQRFYNHNEYIRERFFPSKQALFDSDFSRYPLKQESIDKEKRAAEIFGVASHLLIEEIQRNHSLNIENLILTAKIAFNEGQLAEAERSLREVLNLQTDNTQVYLLLSKCLYMQQKTGDAVEFATKALSLCPTSKSIRRYLNEINAE